MNDLLASTDYQVLATLRRVGVRRSPVRVQFINRKIIITKTRTVTCQAVGLSAASHDVNKSRPHTAVNNRN